MWVALQGEPLFKGTDKKEMLEAQVEFMGQLGKVEDLVHHFKISSDTANRVWNKLPGYPALLSPQALTAKLARVMPPAFASTRCAL